ncbi:MAG: GSCFA domain-containing protein [Tateyamaria sp.]
MHPYANLGSEAFWKTAVAEPGAHGLTGLWTPKFAVQPEHRIVTAGSCFAQHIGRALRKRGYAWTDFEPPLPKMTPEEGHAFGYGVFSFRTGNIYTPAMLLQWLELAYGDRTDPGEVWEKDGRFFDPLRPVIEPGGFASLQEVQDARENTYAALRKAVETADIFVFTLGLTERWRNSDTGLEYAMCPGTAAGTFDPDTHVFVNANTRQSFAALQQAIRVMRSLNKQLRILLTVSPVPLTATASGQHVMIATQYSKSVLRAVAGMAAEKYPFVDYFPSYEIITNPVFRGMFFAPNMRSVVPEGVETVMSHFFADQARVFGTAAPEPVKAEPVMELAEDAPKWTGKKKSAADVKCEEEMLNAFAK